MTFEVMKNLKMGGVLAVCVALAVYFSLTWIKPHVVTRQQVVDPNLVNTYTGFATLSVFLTFMLLAFATSCMEA